MNIDCKLLQDENGNSYAPITVPNAVRFPNGDNLNDKLGELLLTKQEKVTDGAIISSCYGICNTDTYVAAKEVVIPDFILLKNTPVSIRFNNDLNGINPTLNINSTGAIPMYVGGAPIEEENIKANTVLTMVYDGSVWNVVFMQELTRQNPPEQYVDMGLPSGTLWAKRNLDVTRPNGFAASEFQYECSFFSWGNIEGHNPIDSQSFDYSFTEANYNLTTGAALTGDIPVSATYDAARYVLGAPWRLPTVTDFNELLSNIDFVQEDGETVIPAETLDKRILLNNIIGVYMKSKTNENLLFIASCGQVNNSSSWQYRNIYGTYLSSNIYTGNIRQAKICSLWSNGVNIVNNLRSNGMPIRPVQ